MITIRFKRQFILMFLASPGFGKPFAWPVLLSAVFIITPDTWPFICSETAIFNVSLTKLLPLSLSAPPLWPFVCQLLLNSTNTRAPLGTYPKMKRGSHEDEKGFGSSPRPRPDDDEADNSDQGRVCQEQTTRGETEPTHGPLNPFPCEYVSCSCSCSFIRHILLVSCGTQVHGAYSCCPMSLAWTK